jgi:hypothetical protein
MQRFQMVQSYFIKRQVRPSLLKIGTYLKKIISSSNVNPMAQWVKTQSQSYETFKSDAYKGSKIAPKSRDELIRILKSYKLFEPAKPAVKEHQDVSGIDRYLLEQEGEAFTDEQIRQAIIQLQKRLGIKQTGFYDVATHDALKKNPKLSSEPAAKPAAEPAKPPAADAAKTAAEPATPPAADAAKPAADPEVKVKAIADKIKSIPGLQDVIIVMRSPLFINRPAAAMKAIENIRKKYRKLPKVKGLYVNKQHFLKGKTGQVRNKALESFISKYAASAGLPKLSPQPAAKPDQASPKPTKKPVADPKSKIKVETDSGDPFKFVATFAGKSTTANLNKKNYNPQSAAAAGPGIARNKFCKEHGTDPKVKQICQPPKTKK